MGTKRKNSFLTDAPSTVLAVLCLIGATLVLFGLGEGVGNILNINKDIAGAIPYVIFDLLIAGCCFFIVKINPKSIWYVPLICNALGIIAAFAEPSFWKTSLWMLICGGWVLSLIASLLAARTGRKTGANNPGAAG